MGSNGSTNAKTLAAVRRYGIAVLLAATALWLSLFLEVSFGNPFWLFFPSAVIASTWFCGKGPGWLTTAVSMVVVQYYFIPPLRSFEINIRDLPFSLTFLACQGFATWLVSRRKHSEESLRRMNAALTEQMAERERAEETLRKMRSELARRMTGTSGRSPVEGAPDADVQHYALAAWGCGDGMWDYDPATGAVWYSGRFGEMLGYEEREFGDTLESWSSLLHPDDRDRILATFDAHVVGNEPYDVEYRLRSKLGKYRWFRARGRALRHALGSTIRTAGSITDINDLKEREEELRESEAYNKMLFQDSQRAMVVYDPVKDGFIDCNPAAVKMYGFSSREEVLGKTPPDVSAPTQYDGTDTLTAVRRQDHGALTRGVEVFEWRHQRPNGEIWDAMVHLMLFKYRGRELLQFTLDDITERRRNELALKESEERFRRLFEDSADAMLLIDVDSGRFVECNLAAVSMMRMGSRDDLLHREPADLSPPEQADGLPTVDKVALLMNKVLELGSLRFEWLHRRGDGEVFPVEVLLTTIKHHGRRMVHTVWRDITERKQLEADLVSAKEAAEESARAKPDFLANMRHEIGTPMKAILGMSHLNLKSALTPKQGDYLEKIDGSAKALLRMNETLLEQMAERERAEETLLKTRAELARVARVTTVGEFAASVAHEINQPLGAIVANSDACVAWLAEETPNLCEARAAAERAAIAATRASEVIRRIRSLISKEPTERVPVQLNEVISEIVDLTSSQAAMTGVAIAVKLQPNLPQIRGDKIQLQQVILNLITNGIEATSSVTGRARRMEIRSESIGTDEVQVSVCDTGVGVAPEMIPRLFEPFFTTRSQGIGMGLPISRSIIESHGGKLVVESSYGEGSVFRFNLPCNAGQPA